MVFVAKEMQRKGFKIPLMIGGNYIKSPYCCKIDPQYSNDAVIYVADASRAVGSPPPALAGNEACFVQGHRDEYVKVRERLANKQPKAAKLSYAESVKHGFKIAPDYVPPQPNFIGVQTITQYPLETLVEYFD